MSVPEAGEPAAPVRPAILGIVLGILLAVPGVLIAQQVIREMLADLRARPRVLVLEQEIRALRDVDANLGEVRRLKAQVMSDVSAIAYLKERQWFIIEPAWSLLGCLPARALVTDLKLNARSASIEVQVAGASAAELDVAFACLSAAPDLNDVGVTWLESPRDGIRITARMSSPSVATPRRAP